MKKPMESAGLFGLTCLVLGLMAGPAQAQITLPFTEGFEGPSGEISPVYTAALAGARAAPSTVPPSRASARGVDRPVPSSVPSRVPPPVTIATLPATRPRPGPIVVLSLM